MQRTNFRWVMDEASLGDCLLALDSTDTVGLDTEFIRETTFFPQIALLQLATPDQVWLVDPVALQPEQARRLKKMLGDPQRLKVMHAAYGDQECLFHWLGETAHPILDTAIAGALLGYGDSIGLGNLVEKTLQKVLPKGHARAKWLTRPLPEDLVHYAVQDVACLIPMASLLIAKLKKKNRYEWALEESHVDPSQFQMDCEGSATKLLQAGKLKPDMAGAYAELLRWREDLAQRLDRPRQWIVDNETLLSLARVLPRRLEDLRTFRGLKGKSTERNGEEILDAIDRGRAARLELPDRSSRSQGAPASDEVLQLVRAFAVCEGRRLEIASRFLIDPGRVTHLVRDPRLEEWRKKNYLSPWAADLIGEALEAFLQGRTGLFLQGNQAAVQPLKD